MTALPPWLRAHAGKVTVTLAVQPNAKKTEVVGRHGDALKVKVASPPVEGAANAALIEFLAHALAVPKHAVALVRGASSRNKVFSIQGVTLESAVRALAPPGSE